MNKIVEHPRCKIRKAIVEQLKNASTIAKNNVFDSRTKPLFEQHFPALMIYTRDERIIENQYSDDGFSPYKRELELAVEGVMASCVDLDDKIDLLALEVELALVKFEIPGFCNATLKLKSTEVDVIIEGARCFGAVRLDYIITYYTPTLKDKENS